ncbi:short-chain dehydrogenase [Aspergillus pseudoustus]|uniref:Short-chain dehydrogenase n=1 Tax=Aspergillus pseudoustus TaxID=1810923 RepID=A0ABR4KXZ0_9EURO
MNQGFLASHYYREIGRLGACNSEKVVILTGSTSDIGLELSRVLYNAGATVYMAARSEAKAKAAIESITASKVKPSTVGKLVFLRIDLSELRTVKPFVESFLALESRLDLLFNNADCASVPLSQCTAQGLESHLGTNCAAPYLLTQLLAPTLVSTAKSLTSTPNSVREIWSSSITVDALAPRYGIRASDIENPSPKMSLNYALSNTGNWFLASQLAKQLGTQSVVSITQNPGEITTPMYDGLPRAFVWLSRSLRYPPSMGVNTLLWVGLSEDITVDDGGNFAIPFGRWHPYPRKDLLEAMEDKAEEAGDNPGRGRAKAFEEWCARVTREFC